jgi:hypothetical protein
MLWRELFRGPTTVSQGADGGRSARLAVDWKKTLATVNYNPQMEVS